VFNCIPDYRESLCACLAIGHDVVWMGKIEFIDLLAGDGLINLDRALALDRDRLQLFWFDGDVFSFALFIAPNDVVFVDLASRIRIDLIVLDAISRPSVELMKVDFFPLRCSRVKSDWARHQGKAQKSFPIRARGHDGTP